MDPSTSSPLVHTAQLLGLSTSIFLSGINFSASHLTLPILYRLDPERASPGAFAELYHRGARTVVPLAVLSTLASAFVAAQAGGRERAVWAAAAVATFAGLPFTRVVMMETNRALLRMAGEEAEAGTAALLKGQGAGAGAVSGTEVVKLLKRWKRMNMARSAFAMLGGLLAAWAAVFMA